VDAFRPACWCCGSGRRRRAYGRGRGEADGVVLTGGPWWLLPEHDPPRTERLALYLREQATADTADATKRWRCEGCFGERMVNHLSYAGSV